MYLYFNFSLYKINSIYAIIYIMNTKLNEHKIINILITLLYMKYNNSCN